MTDVNIDPKPAVKSLTLQSLVTLAIALALGKAGAALPVGAAHDIAGSLIDLVSMIGLLGAAVGRTRAKAPIG